MGPPGSFARTTEARPVCVALLTTMNRAARERGARDEVTLDESTLQKLDEMFPGPGGQAPDAYAC